MPLNIFVPKSISPEAQEYLSILKQEASVDPFPEPNDLDGWRALHAMNEAYFIDHDADVIDELRPSLEEKVFDDVPVIDVRPRLWQENQIFQIRISMRWNIVQTNGLTG